MQAIDAKGDPVHPVDPTIRGCHHVYLKAPGSTAGTRGTRWPSTPDGSTDRPAAPAPAPGWRSCMRAVSCRSTRTSSTSPSSARSFTGRLVETTEVAGIPAVIPTITGRAWVTGTAQYMLDPSDPFPRGFVL